MGLYQDNEYWIQRGSGDFFLYSVTLFKYRLLRCASCPTRALADSSAVRTKSIPGIAESKCLFCLVGADGPLPLRSAIISSCVLVR